MIKIRTLNIEGFASVAGEPLTFDFKDKGLTVIRGVNGVGKTTLFSAISWALYGKALKDNSSILTWDESRPKDYQGCKVELTVDVGGDTLHIIRCLEYKGRVDGVKGGNRLVIKGGGDIPKKQRDVKAWLENKLGYSFDLFRNSIAFGQKAKRLIEESNSKRKEIFEQALDINFITNAQKKIEAELKEIGSELREYEQILDEATEYYDEALIDLKDGQKEVENFEKEKAEDISEIRKRVSEIKAEIRSLNFKNTPTPNTLKGLKVEKAKYTKIIKECRKSEIDEINLKHELSNLNRELYNKGKELEKNHTFINQKAPVCDSCGQPLKGKVFENGQKIAKRHIKEIEAEIKEVNKKKKKVQSKLNGLQGASDLLKRTEKDLKKVKKSISKIKAEKAEYKANKEKASYLKDAKNRELSRIKSIKTRKCSVNLEKLEERVKTRKKAKRDAKLKLRSIQSKYNTLKWLKAGPLSNSGIKAYLLDQALIKVNARLKEYSRFVGFNVEFGIDLESRYKDFYQFIYKDGILKPYNDLSGGQKQLVDVITAFAMEDIASESRGCNIMLMDEVFESLSKDNIEVIGEIISNKALTRDVYLVTHRDDFQPVNSQEVKIKSKKGLTQILSS